MTLTEIERATWMPDDELIRLLGKVDGDLVVLGAAGKVGVSLCRMARAAFDALSGERQVYAVSRFSDADAHSALEEAGVRTVRADLLDESAVDGLPDAANVVFMVGRKFGTTGSEALTWAVNTYLPGVVARRYQGARMVAFSSGNVYPLVPAVSGGCDEATPPDPVGEYAQSCLGRERVLTHACETGGTPLALIRLNYAIDCRYGVLTDIARAVRDDEPVALGNGAVNVVWQGDANRYALTALTAAATPALTLNVTGPETISTRWLAYQLGQRLGATPRFSGSESDTALLSNAAACFGMFGYPRVCLAQMLDWTVEWLVDGGETLDKPTHFATRTGRF